MVWCGVVWCGVVWWVCVVWCDVVVWLWCGCGVVWCGVVVWWWWGQPVYLQPASTHHDARSGPRSHEGVQQLIVSFTMQCLVTRHAERLVVHLDLQLHFAACKKTQERTDDIQHTLS